MMPERQSMNITRGILYGVSAIMLLFVIYGFFSYWSVHRLMNLTRTIYDQSYVVSNAACQANSSIMKMRLNMKDILSFQDPEIQSLSIDEINGLEKRACSELQTIEDNILGEEGRILAAETIQLLNEWRPVREQVIQKVREGDYKGASDIISEGGREHVLSLESRMQELTRYARNMTSGFLNESENQFSMVQNWSAILIIFWFLVSGVIFFVTVKRTGAMEKQLAHEKETLKVTLKSIGDGVIATNRNGEITLVNKIAEYLTGWKEEEVLGRDINSCLILINKQDRRACDNPVEKVLATKGIVELNDTLLVSRDGTERIIACSGAPIKDMEEKVLGVALVFRDQTADHVTLKRIEESEKKYRLLSEHTLDVIWTMNMDLEFTYVNPAIFLLTGYEVEEWVGTRLPEHCDEETFIKMSRIISDEIAKGRESRGAIFEAVLLKKNREPVSLEIRGRIIFDDSGNPAGLQGLSRDIGERKRAEEALRQSLDKYERTFQSVPVWVVISGLEDGKYIEVNETFLKAMGYGREEIIGRSSLDINSWVDPHQRELIVKEIKEKGHVYEKDVRIRVHSGKIIDAIFSAEAMILDGQQVMLSVIRDITEQKMAEIDRDKLQGQLLQAQKMESVGRLAGGVAHDYNNMLGVILGYTEILLENRGPEDPIYEDLREILDAAKRSSDITRQLLAFARKQTVNPRVIDLNSSVESMLKMIRRLIGEDIDLAWFPCGEQLQVNIDPIQINQIMANLCVNARDAIKGIGKLTIETDHASMDDVFCEAHPEFSPGEYVVLSVSDDGIGMDQETLQNIFDPFFTTKGVGKGTGLGLSTVYGIVRQNEGMIDVSSEKDKGTTFKLYFPLYSGDLSEDTNIVITETPLSKGETVLIVEDDPAMLKMGLRMLEQLRYRVISASTPGDALGLVREYRENIDLLVTDVIMPEMNGRDLESRVRLFYPKLKVLYMSGYTANVIAHRGVLDKGVCFVQKPFSKKDFAIKIREALQDPSSCV